LFCELGTGGAGIRRFLEHPETRGFPGWLVLEQDRVQVGPGDVEQIAEVERRHLALVDELLAAPQGRPEA
jgi:hypothetical protein